MRRISIKTVYCLIVVTLTVAAAFGQARNITRGQYFDAINAAFDKSDAVYPRRYTSSQQFFSDDSEVLSERTEEYLSASKFRKTIKKTGEGVTDTNQIVRIDNLYFCKIGTGEWKKSRTNCEPVSMMMSPQPDSERFSVEELSENGKRIFLYRMFTTRSWRKGANTGEFFVEQIVKVSEEGLSLSWKRTESKRTEGGTKGNEITQLSTGTYEFSVTGLDIVAPIK